MTPLPPKQGLKQSAYPLTGAQTKCYDTTSTKTRIETSQIRPPSVKWIRYDTTSTKTRIETERGKNEKKHKSRYDTTSTKTRIETKEIVARTYVLVML